MRLAFVLAALILPACAAGPPQASDPEFASCEEARRSVQTNDRRTYDVFATQNCGEDYIPFSAYARTPSGERCHIGYRCTLDRRVDPL